MIVEEVKEHFLEETLEIFRTMEREEKEDAVEGILDGLATDAYRTGDAPRLIAQLEQAALRLRELGACMRWH